MPTVLQSGSFNLLESIGPELELHYLFLTQYKDDNKDDDDDDYNNNNNNNKPIGNPLLILLSPFSSPIRLSFKILFSNYPLDA